MDKVKECINKVTETLDVIKKEDRVLPYHYELLDIFGQALDILQDADRMRNPDLGTPRLTNFMLSYMLSTGYGQVLDTENDMVMNFWSYERPDGDKEIPDGFLIRKWGSDFTAPYDFLYYDWLRDKNYL